MSAGRDQSSNQASGSRACHLAESRIAIEAVSPLVDDGRFAAKVIAGQAFTIAADIFADGHDLLGAAVELHDGDDVISTRLEPVGNDRWQAEVTLPRPGLWQLVVLGWRDLFASWQSDSLVNRRAKLTHLGGL